MTKNCFSLFLLKDFFIVATVFSPTHLIWWNGDQQQLLYLVIMPFCRFSLVTNYNTLLFHSNVIFANRFIQSYEYFDRHRFVQRILYSMAFMFISNSRAIKTIENRKKNYKHSLEKIYESVEGANLNAHFDATT